MSTYAYSDIYDCAACGEALAYPVNEDGEALDGGDLVCLTCVLSYAVDMRTGTLVRASEVIERLTAERAALLAPVEGVDVGAMLSDPDRPWLFAPWVDVQARLDVVPILAREVIRLRVAHPSTPPASPE